MDTSIYLELAPLIAWRAKVRRRKLAPMSRLMAQSGGQHRAIRKGRGMEFSDIRPYQAGDEVRLMDWKITARTQKPHIKVFTEAQERPTVLLIDQTAAMFFASQKQLKSSLALHLSAIIGWVTLQQQDRIGGLVFDEQAVHWIPPQRSHMTLMAVLHQALRLHQKLSHPGKRQAEAWQQALMRVSQHLPHGSKVVLIGDLLAFDMAGMGVLHQLRRSHDVVALNVFDPLEAGLPNIGAVQVRDEAQVLQLDTRRASMREAYAKSFVRQWQPVRKRLLGLKIPVFSFSTHEDALVQLQQQGVVA